MVKSLEEINNEFISGNQLTDEDYDEWFLSLLDNKKTDESNRTDSARETVRDTAPAAAVLPKKKTEQEKRAELEELYELFGEEAPEESEEAGEPPHDEDAEKKAKKNAAKRVSDAVFYIIIALILITTLVYSSKTGSGVHLFGYSGFTVLTPSMQREIPQGSLIITKEIDPEEIKIGDDITFIRSDNITVTHRVVDVIENYQGSEQTVFQTKGLENPEPDMEYVFPANVIGVVKFKIPELGNILKYVSENIGLVFLVLGGVLVAIIAFGRVFSMSSKEKDVGKCGSYA